MELTKSWTDLKVLITSKRLLYQYDEPKDRDYYIIFAIDGPVIYKTKLEKGSTDAIDFETNNKTTANKSTNGTIEKRIYQTVSSYGSTTLDYVVPNGVTLRVLELGGSAARNNDIKVEIMWDALGSLEKIFSTHGDQPMQHSMSSYLGNGVKIMRIKLSNDSSQTETIGGYWIGEEY